MTDLSMTGRHCTSTVAGLATLLGVCAVLFGPLRPNLQTFIAVGILGLAAATGPAALRILFGRVALQRRPWLTALAIACLAAIVTLGVALDQLARRWPVEMDGTRVIAYATVDSLTRQVADGVEFDAELAIESPANMSQRLRVRILWREAPQQAPRAGERWRLLLRLDAPRLDTNPGAFDEQREFFRDRLQARAVVLPFRGNVRESIGDSRLLAVRERIAAGIREAVVDRDAAALFAGLAVGATGAISREQWRVFSATGTTHLVAISGMHVTLFCWIVVALMRRLWGSLPACVVRVDREVFAAGFGVCAAAAYALLAGFGVPTQRTVLMLATWWALRLAGRVHAPFDVLGIAVIGVLALDPLGPLSSGFWLSFVAMATLIVTGETPVTGWRGWILENLRTQWRVGGALLPLTIAWFQGVSLAGLVVNLVAIPVFSFVLVPVALVGSALQSCSSTLAAPLWWIGERVHDFLWPALVAVASQPFAVLTVDMPGWQLALLSVFAAVIVFAPQMPSSFVRPATFAALLGIALALLRPADRHPRPGAGEVMITVLDAGDAAAFVVRTAGHALVYDTGESHDNSGAGAERLVLPALRELGVDRLDALVLSLTHAQRAAGAGRLLAALPIKRVLGGGEWPGARYPVELCSRHSKWHWDGVQFEAFGIEGGSCLLKLGFGSGPALLFAERIDAHEASALAASPAAAELLRASLLVAPRRGSAAAFDADFVAAVDPHWLLVSGRDGSRERRESLAARWGMDDSRIVLTGARGAYTLHLRAGLPPRWIEPLALQHRPVWRYHPGVMRDSQKP